MSRLHIADLIALIVLIVGGLNWGLVGFFQFDLVAETVGRLHMTLARIVYVVVGLSAIYTAVRSPGLAHEWHEHRPHPA